MADSFRKLLSKSAMDFGSHSRLELTTSGMVRFWKAHRPNRTKELNLIGSKCASGATFNLNARLDCLRWTFCRNRLVERQLSSVIEFQGFDERFVYFEFVQN
jgi:hypothetical protein